MSEQILGSNYTLDLANMPGIDITSLAIALSDANSEIIERINETVQHYLEKGEVPGHDPSYAFPPELQAAFPNGWFSMLWHRIGRKCAIGSSKILLFPIAVYLYDCYGLSPSKLLLGYEMNTTLPSWLQNWLEQVSLLSEDEYNTLYNILDAGRRVRQEVVYTLKDRISELAAAHGAHLEDFVIYPGILKKDVSEITAFSQTSFREKDNPYPAIKPFFGNHKMLRLIICLCALYKVSPEYLLLQDYSEFSVMESGRPYPFATRQLISRILTADATTKAKAIGFVMAATAARLVAEQDLPELYEVSVPNADNGEIINIMDATAYADGSVQKTEIQLVEVFKKKILAMLELGSDPVSTPKIYTLADGHSRLLRKALNALVEEGRIERIPGSRSASYWKLTSKKKK